MNKVFASIGGALAVFAIDAHLWSLLGISATRVASDNC